MDSFALSISRRGTSCASLTAKLDFKKRRSAYRDHQKPIDAGRLGLDRRGRGVILAGQSLQQRLLLLRPRGVRRAVELPVDTRLKRVLRERFPQGSAV